MSNYLVVVGHFGVLYDGEDYRDALRLFKNYSNVDKYADMLSGETVALYQDGVLRTNYKHSTTGE